MQGKQETRDDFLKGTVSNDIKLGPLQFDLGVFGKGCQMLLKDCAPGFVPMVDVLWNARVACLDVEAKLASRGLGYMVKICEPLTK